MNNDYNKFKACQHFVFLMELQNLLLRFHQTHLFICYHFYNHSYSPLMPKTFLFHDVFIFTSVTNLKEFEVLYLFIVIVEGGFFIWYLIQIFF